MEIPQPTAEFLLIIPHKTFLNIRFLVEYLQNKINLLFKQFVKDAKKYCLC